MFQQFKNIDSAFKHIRLFSIVVIVACVAICCYVIHTSHITVRKAQEKVYVIANDKLLQAIAADRKDKLPVEIRDHVKMFHFYFFTMEPDEQVIKSNVTKAMYLSDHSAKQEYDNLDESGYYTGIVSGNISQKIEADSVLIDINQQPWYFRYYGTIKMVRATSIVTRSLISEGYVRDLNVISDNNPHGFLIERWKIIDNRDIQVKKR